MNSRFKVGRSALTVGIATLFLGGCATVDIDQSIAQTSEAVPGVAPGQLALSRTDAQSQQRLAKSARLLEQTLSMDDAVQLALANSPELQTLLAQGWADLVAVKQSALPANPVFTFERMRFKDELEFDRLLSFGLLDLLTLPHRMTLAQGHSAQVRTQLAAQVIEHLGQVKGAWVRAVAAQQTVVYANQVHGLAQSSAELAQQMQKVGNFNKLQRARQQVFQADAQVQLATAQHAATATREELVRVLGLDEQQSALLKLPDRLPDLPATARPPEQVQAAASAQRLDVKLALQQLEAVGKSRNLNLLASVVDVDLGLRHDTVFDNASGTKANRTGFQLDIRLPVFDWGQSKRESMDAQALLAANHYNSVVRKASSQLRESYSAYRSAHAIARRYRDELLPLRRTISEENLLRYNGMLLGVFELLAETREEIHTVMAAITAEQDFWLTDAALSAALIGKPMMLAPDNMAR